MNTARFVDWIEEYEDWENIGRNAIVDKCTHKHPKGNGESNMSYAGYCDECESYEDSGVPMMNFAYPLDVKPSDEAILSVLDKTNLTVMYSDKEDKHYLALTGGGMDLTQDIALAYYYCQKWIPMDVIHSLCTQKELTVSGLQWDVLVTAVIESIKLEQRHLADRLVDWEKHFSEVPEEA